MGAKESRSSHLPHLPNSRPRRRRSQAVGNILEMPNRSISEIPALDLVKKPSGSSKELSSRN
ncbi:hypothetical protein CASFOL_031882 [Castilleja foliolosa]|uniref:Uncharacterized protein n=1 Tax=Castilleja foliolosa TaxID=1961234 RepID=A0ABD3C1M7_9LAMI